MKKLLLAGALFVGTAASAQTSLTVTKQHPPQLDVSGYAQLAVGDIVGPAGAKTEQSLDLTDALTARLFNAKTVEVLDRNALDNIMGGQRFKDLQVIDEKTTQALNKKLKNALLITGRIQSRPLEQQLIYEDQAIVVNGCSRTYYYQVKSDMTVQLKIIDVRTGKMLFSDAVVKPIHYKTKEDCKVPEKMDLGEISRTAIKDLGEEIAKMLVPYAVTEKLQFSDPGFLKATFKQLKDAAAQLQLKNTDAGLAILKGYTESKDVKDKNKDKAWWNYGLGLLYAGNYAGAKTAFQQCASLNSANATAVATLVKWMDDDEAAARKLQLQEEARRKLSEGPAENTAEKTEAAKPAAKPKAKTKKA